MSEDDRQPPAPVRHYRPRRGGTLVTSAQLEVRGAHAHLRLWVRGGCAGELVMAPPDAELLAYLLQLIESGAYQVPP